MRRMRPGFAAITTMRVAMKTTSFTSWLTMKMVFGLVSLSSQNRTTSLRSVSAVSASTCENGSSMQRISGSTESARAMPTRCFMPPDSSRG